MSELLYFTERGSGRPLIGRSPGKAAPTATQTAIATSSIRIVARTDFARQSTTTTLMNAS